MVCCSQSVGVLVHPGHGHLVGASQLSDCATVHVQLVLSTDLPVLIDTIKVSRLLGKLLPDVLADEDVLGARDKKVARPGLGS